MSSELNIIPEDLGGVPFHKAFLATTVSSGRSGSYRQLGSLGPQRFPSATAWELRAFPSHDRKMALIVVSRLHCSTPRPTVARSPRKARLPPRTDLSCKLQGGRWPLGGGHRASAASIPTAKPLGPAWSAAFSQAGPLPRLNSACFRYFFVLVK